MKGVTFLQFTLANKEDLASATNDRTLRLRCAAQNTHTYWMSVEQQYQSIDQKALQFFS